MTKVICHKAGNVYIKCKSCDHSWHQEVNIGETIDDKCFYCGTESQETIIVKNEKDINIPEFMSKPKKVITLAEEDLTNFIEREARVRVERFNAGFRYGLALGLLITIIALITFIVFAPMSLLLA